MKIVQAASAIAIAFSLSLGSAMAGGDGHSTMKEIPGNKSAVVGAVINSVDAAAKQINVTHEAVPEIGWSEMTMDLPVTNKVDLSAVKPGSTVNITLKQGVDKKFRVMAIEPKK